jgi:hypothetical protein
MPEPHILLTVVAGTRDAGRERGLTRRGLPETRRQDATKNRLVDGVGRDARIGQGGASRCGSEIRCFDGRKHTLECADRRPPGGYDHQSFAHCSCPRQAWLSQCNI